MEVWEFEMEGNPWRQNASRMPRHAVLGGLRAWDAVRTLGIAIELQPLQRDHNIPLDSRFR